MSECFAGCRAFDSPVTHLKGICLSQRGWGRQGCGSRNSQWCLALGVCGSAAGCGGDVSMGVRQGVGVLRGGHSTDIVTVSVIKTPIHSPAAPLSKRSICFRPCGAASHCSTPAISIHCKSACFQIPSVQADKGMAIVAHKKDNDDSCRRVAIPNNGGYVQKTN